MHLYGFHSIHTQKNNNSNMIKTTEIYLNKQIFCMINSHEIKILCIKERKCERWVIMLTETKTGERNNVWDNNVQGGNWIKQYHWINCALTFKGIRMMCIGSNHIRLSAFLIYRNKVQNTFHSFTDVCFLIDSDFDSTCITKEGREHSGRAQC